MQCIPPTTYFCEANLEYEKLECLTGLGLRERNELLFYYFRQLQTSICIIETKYVLVWPVWHGLKILPLLL
jgi:hypothetical protein